LITNKKKTRWKSSIKGLSNVFFVVMTHTKKQSKRKDMKISSLSYYIIMCIGLICTLNACNNTQPKETKKKTKTIRVTQKTPSIIETRGIMCDGSSMNVLQIAEYDGDTLDIIAPDQMIMGGLIVGDEVDVVYSMSDSNMVARTAVNVSALQHLWSQHIGGGQKKSLQLDEKGLASTFNMNIQYDRWDVSNGMLMLSTPKKVGDERPVSIDTFQIMMLTEDSLVILHNSANMAASFYNDN